jgi:hypothetical protein
MIALNTGESVVVGTLSPSLQSNQFMTQFYGSPACVSLIDQLSRHGLLSAPGDPTTLEDRYFVCVGSYNDFNKTTSKNAPAVWGNYLPGEPDNSSFPSWFPAASKLNAPYSGNSSGINGSHGTLSYYVDVNPETALGSACVSFFNATTQYGWSTPSAYITGLNCVAENENNGAPIFMSVKNQECQSNAQVGCATNPWVFLHGSPGQITLQTCSYTSGNSLICSFSIN